MNKKISRKITKISFPLALACALGACSSATKNVEQTETTHAEPATGHPTTGNSLQTKFVAAEQDANATAELTFAKGSAKLPKDAVTKIKKAMKEASARGRRVNEVKVVAWADQEYPSTFKDALPAEEQKLANARAEAVAKLLGKTAKGAEVEKISMAERPGALESFFKTSDFRVKRSLERAGIPNENTSVKVPAMERKALVLFLTEDSKANN